MLQRTTTKTKSNEKLQLQRSSPSANGTKPDQHPRLRRLGNFIQEARGALRVADAAIVVVDAVSGIMVQPKRAGDTPKSSNCRGWSSSIAWIATPASFERSLESIQKSLGRMCVPIQIPLGEEKAFKGVVDLIQMKAYVYQTDGSGKFTESDIRQTRRTGTGVSRQARGSCCRERRETHGEFFESGSLTDEEMIAGLKNQVGEGKIYPICTRPQSATWAFSRC